MTTQSTDRYLTVIFEDLSLEEVESLVYHPKCRAASWSHALNDRDTLKWRISKLLNESGTPND